MSPKRIFFQTNFLEKLFSNFSFACQKHMDKPFHSTGNESHLPKTKKKILFFSENIMFFSKSFEFFCFEKLQLKPLSNWLKSGTHISDPIINLVSCPVEMTSKTKYTSLQEKNKKCYSWCPKYFKFNQ